MNFGSNDIFGLGVFVFLLVLNMRSRVIRRFMQSKGLFNWFLDLANIFIQGTLIPLIQLTIVVPLLIGYFPSLHKSLKFGFWGALIVNLFLVDYLYYWNHRILHYKKLFPIHLIHHTVNEFDIFATSRNTLWTSFFIIYLPVGSLFLFLLDNPAGYLWGVMITALFDCWKHSKLKLPFKVPLVLTPQEHSYHHGKGLLYNYGANFNIWDKLHGTYKAQSEFTADLGVKVRLSAFDKALNPFSWGHK